MEKIDQGERSLKDELIALNAQFEAARVGEAGTAFACETADWMERSMPRCGHRDD